jgi:hypothetical protein
MADPITTVNTARGPIQRAAENAFRKFSEDCLSNQQVQASGSPTDYADPDKCDIRQLAKDTTEDLRNAIKEDIKNAMTEAGATAEEADEWLESHAEDIWAKCEEIRNSRDAQQIAPKVRKWAHGLKVAVIAAVVSVVGIAFVSTKHENALHGDGQTAVDNLIVSNEVAQQFHEQMNQYNAMMNDLKAPVDSAPEEPQAQAAPEGMPAAVAAVAAAPIAVIIEKPVDPQVGGAPETQTVQTTVGQVWHAIPNARGPIREATSNTGYTPGWAEKTERWPGDYAAHAGESGGSRGGTLHVNATVTSPWGATVHIESH